MNKWIEIHSAYQVAKLGTVSAAANSLGVHRVTVSRHIDALETALGSKLFQRHGRGYTLTERGREFLSVVSQADELIRDFAGRSQALQAELSGELILASSPGLHFLFIRPAIAIRKIHRNIQIKIVSQNDLVKLEYGEAHVALVAGPKPDNPDYIVTRFNPMNMTLYAHRSYITRRGMPDSIEDFCHHDFICNLDRESCTEFERWLLDNVPAESIVYTTSQPNIANMAIMTGAAIGFLPDLYAQCHGNMEKITAINKSWHLPVWIVTHVDMHRTEKVQSILKAIREEYKAIPRSIGEYI